MGHIVNIAYLGGHHGNFLRYFIDRFSSLTPDILELPFIDNGTSHSNKIKYSGRVNRYHPIPPQNDGFINMDEPHIFITCEKKDMHYLHRLSHAREDIDNTGTPTLKQINDNIEVSNNFLQLYKHNLEIIYDFGKRDTRYIPKFIIRDMFKLNFLNIEKDGVLVDNMRLKEKIPKKTFLFPVDAFWNTEKFIKTVAECNQYLNLQIQINNTAVMVHEEFIKRLHDFEIKDRCVLICEKILNNQQQDISMIDVLEEAYISAWIERTYDNVICSPTNNFFQNTLEIVDWINWYPNHYKAMNPNIPTFKGDTNPFYLWKKIGRTN